MKIFEKQWYEDEDVKTMIKQIEKVMNKYDIDRIKFESYIDYVKLFSSNTGKKVNHYIKNGFGNSFELTWDKGNGINQIII